MTPSEETCGACGHPSGFHHEYLTPGVLLCWYAGYQGCNCIGFQSRSATAGTGAGVPANEGGVRAHRTAGSSPTSTVPKAEAVNSYKDPKMREEWWNDA